jgi:hypothetical protein
VFAFTGFQVGTQTFTQFQSPKGGKNYAMLRGSFVDPHLVPGPIVGAGVPGLIAASLGLIGLIGLVRRRKALAGQDRVHAN